MPPTDLSNCLIYGAYGYTGDLIVQLATAAGLKPILSGRSAHKLEPFATRHGLSHRAVSLDDDKALDAALDGIDLVLHCAGPFSRTYKAMAKACIRNGAHYLDITGEIGVFEGCAARSKQAAAAGVTLMPGVGFDVVPSDCLASHLKGRLPDATHLTLAFKNVGGSTSHGTATTMVENLGGPNAVRRDGKIVPVRMGALSRDIDFGRGPRPALAIPWGDVSTAYHSTGIPNIEVYIGVSPSAVRGAWIGGYLSPLMRTSLVRGIAQRRVEAAPAGPSAEVRDTAFTLLWGEARSPSGTVQARMKAPEAYTLTALTALEAARRVAAGDLKVGFQTPSMAWGADFILEFDGVTREDLG